ncbi:AMP-binding protein [Maritimibacter sp. UBA3975]|uniref:AMP-binding protein n=1 Tax=Maritimibacter sp. UBA3975 TaxID=1946833 RepID=UPI000C0B5D71|nr:AMP-binding protein [Maritimibacter sp. UBA3975]MAM60066.1 acyl-CoA synthetase [Maritimibacter sp.]|tara:strand:- start:5928 stop:7739 length:1812 start_codon:yes stop_codon:yes gene_type:complete
MTIRTASDIATLEARGFDTVFPHQTPWDILRHQAATRPDAVAIRYIHDAADPSRDEAVTYADFASRVMGAARLFRANGVTAEKSVAILTQHTVSAQTALWGAQVAGRACPINPMLKPDHIASLIRAADAGAVVIMGVNGELDYWSALVPALRAEGIDLPIFACDADADSPGADGVFEERIARPGEDIVPEGDQTALAAFYHTGGTTGAPKLVQHMRLNEAHVARSCALMHDLGPEDVVVNGFPLFHVAGAFVYGLSTISAGGTLVVPGRLGMRNAAFMGSIWQQVERLGITVLGVVPTILATLKATPVDADISTLKWLLTGGSPLPTELAEAAEAHTGVPVRNILGMTECAGAIAVEPVQGSRTPLSCGLRMPFSEIAIFGETEGDADPAKPLAPGETGIVALRGPNVAAGYSDPARNAGTFLDGGWLVSGDLGRVDDAGRLFIVGRKKDVIIRGAHNIDPQMIEDALLAHPDVLNAAAVGMPDAYAGELPVAFAETRAGATVTEAALIDFLRDRIEDPVALPKRVGMVEAMPLTPVGKIFKPTLRAEAIRWAIAAAGETLGVSPDVRVDDKLATTVAVPADRFGEMRDALAGMPITLTVVAI